MNTPSHANPDMTPEMLVLEFFERVWHAPHELEAIHELMTEDYTITTAGKTISGREAFKTWVRDFQKVLLDAKTESVDLFSDSSGEKIVSRWVCSGRNNGLFGTSPDQQSVSFTGIAVWTVRNGRLSACWVERSAYELYVSLTSGPGQQQFV